MDNKRIIESLHAFERKVLGVLDKYNSLKDIAKESGLDEISAMRGLQWLSNKKIVSLKDDLKEVVSLGKNGKKYLGEGLPEKKLIEVIGDSFVDASTLFDKAKVKDDEKNICIGLLKKNSCILISKEKDQLMLKRTPAAKVFLEKILLEEKFLKKEFPVSIDSLNDDEKNILDELLKRKDIVNKELVKLKTATLTPLGKEILKKGLGKGDYSERLTTEMLKTGRWEDKKFRRYDVEINVPKIFGGKKQHYRRFLDYVRRKFLSLGFIERDGPIVECDFWDMDALYMPQFHSARDIHDAYYIKEPKFCKLDEKIVKKVKEAHEKGVAGSKGWQYKFDMEKTKRNLLRTHDTAVSARTLASKDLQIPGKYFQISRCFRPDVIDASHNVDFNQVGGFVLGENLNLRHLFGLLQMFAKEFAGTEEIRLVPGYFPFTEPSVELHAKHPELGWIELAGAGIFRPELTWPLGVRVPVIAWGVGVDRLAMFKLGIKDIRQLFSHDLDFLRNARVA